MSWVSEVTVISLSNGNNLIGDFMCTKNEKDHHWDTTIIRGIVVSRVRVYNDLNDKSVIHRVDVIPLDAGEIRVITLETYASEEVSIDTLELGDTVFSVVVSDPSVEFNDRGSRISTVYSAVKVLVEECEPAKKNELKTEFTSPIKPLIDKESVHHKISSHVDIIRKRTDSWYAKHMGDSLAEPEVDSIFMAYGRDFLCIEDALEASSRSGSSSEKACVCGDEPGLCGPPL